MRIVHVIDYFQPQLGYQETYLAREHQRAGHDVHVVTSDRYLPEVRKIVAERRPTSTTDEACDFTIHRLKLIGEYRTRVWLRHLESKICELEPDLIIMHGIISITTIRIAILKKRLPKTKIIIDCHANYVNSRHRLRKQFYTLYRRFVLSMVQNNADAIVAVDSNSKEFLIHECGFTCAQICIIPLGADTNIFRFNDVVRDKLRCQLGIDPTDIVCVFSGKISRIKDVHLFIDAGLNILHHDSRIRMLIVGDGDTAYIEEMKAKIHKAGHVDKVYWTGFLSSQELAEHYSASDISIWPKQVSIGTLEAQSCGLPLIVADTPMLRDRVCNNSGLVFAPNSVESLQQKLELLVNDDKYRRRLGRAGRSIVESDFNWTMIAQNFIKLVN